MITTNIQIKMDLNKALSAANTSADKSDQKPGEEPKTQEDNEFSDNVAPPKLVTFSYKMLDIPELKYSPAKDTIKHKPTSENPYFTDTAMYPVDLPGRNKQEILNFFFNKYEFEKVMLQEGTNWVDLTKVVNIKNMWTEGNKDIIEHKQQNEKYNVMMMLNCLFEVDPLVNQSVVSTYDQYILKKTPDVWNVGFYESINFFGLMEKVKLLNPERGVRLKIDGATKIIAEVKWTNDLIRHPDYLFFIKTYNNEMGNLSSNLPEIDNELTDKKKSLEDKIGKMKIVDDAIDFCFTHLTNTSFFNQIQPKLSRGISLQDHYKYYLLSNLSIDVFTKNATISTLRPNADEIIKQFNILKKDKSFLTYVYTLEYSIDTEFVSSRDISESKRTNTRKVIDLLNIARENMSNMNQLVNNLMQVGITIDESAGTVTYQNHLEFFTKDIVNKMDFSIMTLVTQISALFQIADFVGKGITMNMGENRPDGSPKTAFEKKTDTYLKTKPLILNASESIDKAISTVYTDRKSSNMFLYSIIQKTKTGVWNMSPGMTPYEKKREKQKQEAFSRIYKKYIIGEPLDVDIYEIKNCLYTGVDTLLKASDKIGTGTREICVYLNLLDDKNVRKKKTAKCVQRDDSLTNLLKYLLFFNTEEPMNTFRDFRLSAPYVETETEQDTKVEAAKKDGPNDAVVKKGGTRRHVPKLKRRLSRKRTNHL